MRISVKERRVREEELLSYKVLFDIVLWPYYGESDEKVNKKGNRFRNKTDKLKGRNDWVGHFMPIGDGEVRPHAFFVITCSVGSRMEMRTNMRGNVEDGDLLIFR